jgi:hypothetical protein
MRTGKEVKELLQTIYSFFDKETGYKLFNVDSWGDKEQYDRLFEIYKDNLYSFICSLDSRNLELIFKWANKKNYEAMAELEKSYEEET